jgi:hypothetical protein
MDQRIKEMIKEKVIELLVDADFFMMPLEWVKDRLSDDSEIHFDLSDDCLFTIIQEYEEFRLFESPEVELSAAMQGIISKEELKKMGFCNNRRVMLKERTPTKTELIEFLLNKANQTFETLKKAWDIRPDNNQEIEDQLLLALAKSQKLQRELNIVLTDEIQKQEVTIN